MEDTLRIAHLKITNLGGIDELEFKAGKWNLIEGDNGKGKTTVLNAIRAISKAPLATLLRNGAEKGEVVAILSDGTSLTRTISPTGTKIEVRQEGKIVPGGAKDFLKSTVDALSINPVEFLRSGDTPAGKRQRLDWLLEVLPVPVDYARVSEIVRAEIKPVEGRNGLERMEGLYKEFFDERTAVKRTADEKAGTIKQLQDAIPAESDLPSADPSELEAQIAGISSQLETDLAGVDTKLAGYRTEHAARADAIRAEIADAQARLSTEMSWMTDVVGKAEGRKATLKGEAATAREKPATQLATIRANQDAASKAAGTRETIKKMEVDENRLRDDVSSLTTALDGLTKYKAELLSNLPIDGLSVSDGEIYRHGVPYDALNKAQQVDIAVEVAKLRAGELGVICVDELESLSSIQLAAFREKVLAEDLQLFVTRVSDGDFNITSEG